jgi:hypothetical protein
MLFGHKQPRSLQIPLCRHLPSCPSCLRQGLPQPDPASPESLLHCVNAPEWQRYYLKFCYRSLSKDLPSNCSKTQCLPQLSHVFLHAFSADVAHAAFAIVECPCRIRSNDAFGTFAFSSKRIFSMVSFNVPICNGISLSLSDQSQSYTEIGAIGRQIKSRSPNTVPVKG